MRGFSKAIITGNITRDPELKAISSGSSVCSFGVAVNRTYRDASGNQKEEVSFFDCDAWGGLGETIAKYGKKGSGVLVCGRLQQRSFTDNNGQKRSRVTIVVEDFNFVGSNSNGQGGGGYGGNDSSSFGGGFGGGEAAGSAATEAPVDMPAQDIDLDEIPF